MHGLLDGDPYVTFSLFQIDARPGDRPLVEVDADIDDLVGEIEQGQVVKAAGTICIGHAIVVIVDGRAYWPRYPGTLRMRPHHF